MSRGFVEDGLGTGCVTPVPLRTVVEGVPGFADAVESGALDGDAEGIAAAPEGVAEGIVDGAAVADPDGIAVIDVVDAGTGVMGGGFLSSVAMIPNVTATPVSVASAAVTSATPNGRFPGFAFAAVAFALPADGLDPRDASPLGRLPASLACVAFAFGFALASTFALAGTAAPAASSDPTPSRVAALSPLASSGIDGRDERTGEPSSIVASSAFTAAGFATGSATNGSATGSSGTRARSSGATSCNAASIASAVAKRLLRSRASARATNAETGAGTDGSMVQTSGASRMQIERMTCS